MAAPAIIRFDNIMPVRALPPELLAVNGPGPRNGLGMVVRAAVSLSPHAEVGRLFGRREDRARQCAGQEARDRARAVLDRHQEPARGYVGRRLRLVPYWDGAERT